jgi:MFS transporter, DHA2 family, methylenomycin A resistance protein
LRQDAVIEASRSKSITLAAMTLGFAVVQLDVTVVNVGIRGISASLGSSVAGLQWVVSSYALTLAALILTAGALGDRVGAKRLGRRDRRSRLDDGRDRRTA